MFWHRAGYKPTTEAMATHSRRRYRLLPSNQIGMANPDPSFWLVHYSKAQARDQHPAASLQMLPHITQQFQQRQTIQRSGQIPRKEFMLHDRSNWPVISAPAGVARAGSSGQLVGGHRRGQSLVHEASAEEEEDVSRGDALDFMTPRDISKMRYEQHHEWMEEVLESPYGTKQIIPSELGLGRKGTLEAFTNGFFTAPTSTTQDTPNGKIGRMDADKAEEFTKHANQKLAEMQAELEQLKQRHIRRMEKLRRTTELGTAERKLRGMNVNGADDSFKVVASQVQDMVGKKIEPVAKVACVSKGGMQEIKPVAPAASENMQQNAPAMQQQLPVHTQYQQQRTLPQAQQQQQVQPQQNQQAHMQQQVQTAQKTVPQAQNNAASTTQSIDTTHTAQPPALPKTESSQDDSNAEIENNDAVDNNDEIDMVGLDDHDLGTGDDNVDIADWDMVNDQATANESSNEQDQGTNQTQAESQQSSSMNQPHIQQSNQSSNNTPGDTGDFDMVTDFDANMDTAGDALADYNADEDLNLDDSAFGDAFHHNEQDMS